MPNSIAKYNSSVVALLFIKELQDGITIESNYHDTIRSLELDKTGASLRIGRVSVWVYIFGTKKNRHLNTCGFI